MKKKLSLAKVTEESIFKTFDQCSRGSLTSRASGKKKHETVKVLPESLPSRSISNRNLTVFPRNSIKSIENLRLGCNEPNTLPRIKRFIHFIKPSRREYYEVAQLLNVLPIKINYLQKSISLQRPKTSELKKTLILDLDETLTHSIKQQEEGHIKLSITDSLEISVNIRPFVHDLLKFASVNFEVIIFTASQSKYADTILDHLDPLKKYIHHRLYREHCFEFHGYYLKDLRIIENRDLKDIIIVDNSMTSYALQIENGIPISS